jgi:hypothetical protein
VDWQILLTTLSATGVASAAFVFLAKALSKHFLSLDLERFKGELKATHEKELERLRADLRLAAFRQETTFAKLHDKRAEVIAELYAKLATVNGAMHELLSPLEVDGGAGREKREKSAAEAGNDFRRYYDRHLIYFDESLCNLLHSFSQDMMRAWVIHLHNPTTGEGGINRWEPRMKAWERLNEQVPKIRTEIEQNFRQLLGLPPPSHPPTKSE